MQKITTKYHGEIDLDLYKKYTVKNIFKLLPLKEENKDWEKYLDGLLVELSGLSRLSEDMNLVSLIAKLEGLRTVEDHSLFRKVVFDCIDNVKKMQVK